MSNSSTTSLPPGFRFHPTDEELILHYLRNRAAAPPCPVSIIAEVDIYKFDPWELPAKATFGDREWYFFSPRDRKYPNGVRPNRAAGSGYWKATGTDKPIHGAGGAEESSSIGVKKALVFYTGKPPKGQKTDWIMHEYRLAEAGNTNTYKPLKLRDRSMRLDDWVLCRIYKKSSNLPPVPPLTDDDYVSGAEDVNVMQTLQAAAAGGGSIAQEAAPTKLATKSFSISELFDDYSAVSDNLQFDAAQHPAELPGGFDYSSLLAHAHVPPLFGGGLGCENTGGYQIPKRQRTTSTGDGYGEPCFAAPANLSDSNQFDSSQYGLLINQQLLLNSHLGLHCTEHAAQELIHHISHK